MSPIGWALQPLKKYADFRGRASRAEFWWFTLFMVILYFVFWVVMIGSIGGLAAVDSEPSAGMIGALGVGFIVMMLFWLAVLIPTLAVQVRRLHDTNRSGWWLGSFYLLYVAYIVLMFGGLGFAMSAEMDGSGDPAQASGALLAASGLIGLAFFVYTIVLLVFYCLPGTRGANRFGPDPYGADVAEVFA